MYKNYIFDLYGTLVDIRTDEEDEAVWEKLSLFYGYHGAGYEPGELKAYYKKLVKSRMKEKSREAMPERGGMGKCKKTAEDAGKSYEAYPEIRIEEVFSELFMLKGITADPKLSVYAGQFFRILSTEYIRLYPGTAEMLRKIKQRGGRIYLLSNAQRIFTAYEMEYLKLTEYFDGILLSSDVGVRKPEKRFFEILMERYCLKPEESIMTGNDEACDIFGARQMGMAACYIHSNISPEYTGMVKPTCRMMETDMEKVYDMIAGDENKRQGCEKTSAADHDRVI